MAASVVDTYERLLEAWNRRDADAFAALFAEDGSSVGFDGSQMNGRGEIGSELRAIFASHPGQGEIIPEVNAVQSRLVVDEDEQPRIALLQSTPAAFHGRPHLAAALTEELTAVLRTGRVVERV